MALPRPHKGVKVVTGYLASFRQRRGLETVESRMWAARMDSRIRGNDAVTRAAFMVVTTKHKRSLASLRKGFVYSLKTDSTLLQKS